MNIYNTYNSDLQIGQVRLKKLCAYGYVLGMLPILTFHHNLVSKSLFF